MFNEKHECLAQQAKGGNILQNLLHIDKLTSKGVGKNENKWMHEIFIFNIVKFTIWESNMTMPNNECIYVSPFYYFNFYSS